MLCSFRNLCHEEELQNFVCLIGKQVLKVSKHLFMYINSNCFVQMLQNCVSLMLCMRVTSKEDRT